MMVAPPATAVRARVVASVYNYVYRIYIRTYNHVFMHNQKHFFMQYRN